MKRNYLLFTVLCIFLLAISIISSALFYRYEVRDITDITKAALYIATFVTSRELQNTFADEITELSFIKDMVSKEAFGVNVKQFAPFLQAIMQYNNYIKSIYYTDKDGIISVIYPHTLAYQIGKNISLKDYFIKSKIQKNIIVSDLMAVPSLYYPLEYNYLVICTALYDAKKSFSGIIGIEIDLEYVGKLIQPNLPQNKFSKIKNTQFFVLSYPNGILLAGPTKQHIGEKPWKNNANDPVLNYFESYKNFLSVWYNQYHKKFLIATVMGKICDKDVMVVGAMPYEYLEETMKGFFIKVLVLMIVTISLISILILMFTRLEKRFTALEKRYEKLCIHINQQKRDEDLKQIIGTDYFQNLKNKIKG